MKVLVCGASGFIGRAIADKLQAAGHSVVRGVRRAREPGDIAIDYSRDITPADWIPRLAGVDAVVNAIGIIAERPEATFANVHEIAPTALFDACAQVGVKRVVQISALGAEAGDTRYFRTKAAADNALMRLAMDWQVLRPSLVYGEDGASASAFRMLATLPVISIPSLPDSARFQPVHIDDLAAAVEIALDAHTPGRQCINCTGATSHSLREMIGCFRKAFGLGSALWVAVPAPVMAVAARAASMIPGAALNPETWRMLQQGSAGDSPDFSRLLGRTPMALGNFIGSKDAERLRGRAMSAWQPQLLRLSLAAVWVLTAITSAFVFPHASSMAMLAQVGLTGQVAIVALHAASALDVGLGMATLLYPQRITWIVQVVLVVGYSALIAATMPEWLAHPFGPILKNLPILAILAVLIAQGPKCSTSP